MASSPYDGFVLRWLQDPAPGFEDIAGARIVPFDPDAWKAADVRLQPGAGATYIHLAAAGEFGRWWPYRCGGDSSVIRRFRLQLPPTLWERPWEGLVGGLDTANWDQVSLIREVEDDAAPRQPSELAEPLTVLCLQGAASGPGLATLDLVAEFASVTAAYEHLDFAVRQAIAPPVAVKALRDSLVPALLAHRPAVLWFSGHGRADPPGILLDDGQWLPPEGEFSVRLHDCAGP